MNRIYAIALCLALMGGGAIVYEHRDSVAGWVSVSAKPTAAYVVRESGEKTPLPTWANSDQLLDDCKAAGCPLLIVDPDAVDKLGGKTPPELVPVFEAAKKRGLPSLVTVTGGKAKAYAVPKDESVLRAQLKVKL